MKSETHHPYRDAPATAFWKRAVAEAPSDGFDPLIEAPFRIASSDRVATAGSCFAQHLSKALIAEGVNFLKTEAAPEDEADAVPKFSARYGNVYTARQVRQLYQRAYGLLSVPDTFAWQRTDGRLVDPFRPNEFPAGFATAAEVATERRAHHAAVRRLFEQCDVFILTLGLTEVWVSDAGGFALPLPPGVVASPIDPAATVSPKNLSVAEMTDDLVTFIDDLRLVNPGVRIMLTVSPVPIIATFNPRHVIVSNTYTKSALRVVAQQVGELRPDVFYFPSYELAVGHPRLRFFDESLRRISPEGVARVMDLFRRRVLSGDGAPARREPAPEAVPYDADAPRLSDELQGVICDEEMLGMLSPAAPPASGEPAHADRAEA